MPFGAVETLYLGHVVSGHTIAPDQEKLKAVRDRPCTCTGVSQSSQEVPWISQLYFRRFLSGFANIAKPLDEITGKNARFPTLATSLLEQYSYKKLTRSGYLYLWPTPVGNWHPLKWTTRSPKRKPWLWFLLSEIGNCICSNTSMFSRTTKRYCIWVLNPV